MPSGRDDERNGKPSRRKSSSSSKAEVLATVGSDLEDIQSDDSPVPIPVANKERKKKHRKKGDKSKKAHKKKYSRDDTQPATSRPLVEYAYSDVSSDALSAPEAGEIQSEDSPSLSDGEVNSPPHPPPKSSIRDVIVLGENNEMHRQRSPNRHNMSPPHHRQKNNTSPVRTKHRERSPVPVHHRRLPPASPPLPKYDKHRDVSPPPQHFMDKRLKTSPRNERRPQSSSRHMSPMDMFRSALEKQRRISKSPTLQSAAHDYKPRERREKRRHRRDHKRPHSPGHKKKRRSRRYSRSPSLMESKRLGEVWQGPVSPSDEPPGSPVSPDR
jgi:hypothetical protein